MIKKLGHLEGKFGSLLSCGTHAQESQIKLYPNVQHYVALKMHSEDILIFSGGCSSKDLTRE